MMSTNEVLIFALSACAGGYLGTRLFLWSIQRRLRAVERHLTEHMALVDEESDAQLASLIDLQDRVGRLEGTVSVARVLDPTRN